MDYFNKLSGRYNTYHTAKKNGLFINPEGFTFPADTGLDFVARRAVSKKTLLKKIKAGTLLEGQYYLPGFVFLPVSEKLLKTTPKNTAKAQVERVKKAEIMEAFKTKTAVKTAKVRQFKGVAEEWTIETDDNYSDLAVYKSNVATYLKNSLSSYFKAHGAFKVILKVVCEMKKYGKDEYEYKEFVFSSANEGTARPLLSLADITRVINEAFATIDKNVDAMAQMGSGWILHLIKSMRVKVVDYKAFKGASYIDLPAWLKNKKCCVNVKNEDSRCFEYAILSAVYGDEIKAHPERVSHYKKYEGKLNFDGLEFPISADASNFSRFETLNNIPINVFYLNVKEQETQPERYELLYINRVISNKSPINLLLVDDGEKSHYVYIKRLNAFVRTANDDVYCCSKCLQRFHIESAYNNHLKNNKCVEFKKEATKELPKEGYHICEFKNIKKQLKVPFVIYADCESLLTSTNEQKGESTNAYQLHQGNHVGARLVSLYPELLDDSYVQFDGPDCMDNFLNYCLNTYDVAAQIVRENKEMTLTADQVREFHTAVNCHICNKTLNDDGVRDHDHLTGEYRGAAHSACNIAYNYKNFKLPVIFHNLRGYDSHLILQHAGKHNKPISCIPNTMEKYLSFSVGGCVFLDSLQFTLSSLEALVANLNKADGENFSIFNSEFKNESEEVKQLLRQKGVFPYDWYDSPEKLNASELPPIECFFSKLNDCGISEADYKQAVEVWNKAGCKTFNDYLSLYLKTDVILLADVFQAFRNVCYKYYGLDPCHYFTAPGFSWDAMLKMTGVKIECFTEGNLEMLQMVQAGMRGGISMISTRFAKANNKYISGYDASAPSSYLMYLDANNLYGWAMSQYLPLGSYRWEDANAYTHEYILSMRDNQKVGCILEVDLIVPEELHDYFNDYPLAPESTLYEPSPIMQKLREKLDIVPCDVNKLIPNLHNKQKYVLHYRNLKLYLELGLKLDKVHRVLSFEQAPYLEEYINFNTSKRAASKNDFEKDFFKLLNNAIFGKTCENVDKRIEVKLMTNPQKFLKESSKPYFKNFEIFTNDLVACEMQKTKVVYNRPMIVGMCILDLSKVLMYDFHYNTIKRKYGNRATLCFTDTDSLTYHIETDDIYKDMQENKSIYDTSDYPKDHPCYSTENKKVIGKFKDELNSLPMREFCGLRAKMYSILKDETHNKATAKGVKRSVIKTLSHEQYKAAIFGDTVGELKQRVSFNLIRSQNHQISTINVSKTGLCGFDDKRYVLADGIHTLAHGHKNTKTA